MSKLVFETKEEAISFLKNQDYLYEHSDGFSPKGIYYLSGSEYYRPNFRPAKYKDGWGVKKISYFYIGFFQSSSNVRCGILDGKLAINKG